MTALPSPSLPDSPFLQLRLTEYTVLPSCCTTRRPRWSIAGARNICTRYLSVSLPRPKYLHPSSPATRSSLPDATYLRFGAAGQSRPRTHVPALSGPILQHVLTGEGNVRNQTRVRRPVSARSLRCAAQSNIYIRRCVQLLRAKRDLTHFSPVYRHCDSFPCLQGLVVAGQSATRASASVFPFALQAPDDFATLSVAHHRRPQ
ncbi:hypothetical protein BGZ57DRAFT_366617 [Hyaloscypha finlandica]|nr:hypothetical protein BGZ57DRAFT_366617 [Hyaloscypha finlandica]